MEALWRWQATNGRIQDIGLDAYSQRSWYCQHDIGTISRDMEDGFHIPDSGARALAPE